MKIAGFGGTYIPTASSPLPAIVKCKDEETELEWIVEVAIRMSGNQSIAILARNREIVDLVEENCEQKDYPQILKNRMGVLDLNAKISIGTFHSAKGLELIWCFYLLFYEISAIRRKAFGK